MTNIAIFYILYIYCHMYIFVVILVEASICTLTRKVQSQTYYIYPLNTTTWIYLSLSLSETVVARSRMGLSRVFGSLVMVLVLFAMTAKGDDHNIPPILSPIFGIYSFSFIFPILSFLFLIKKNSLE